MTQHAGIALGRLAYDSDFSITRVEHEPNLTFLPPVRHKLVDRHTVEDILNTFYNVVGFDAKFEYNGFMVSIPISASAEQWEAFYEANNYRADDHCRAWINRNINNLQHGDQEFNILFIDLTPGQVASTWTSGDIVSGKWAYDYKGSNYTHLGDINLSRAEDVYDRLVTSIVPKGGQLHQIGILRPEGAFPSIEETDLESKFPSARVDWLTLDDISYGIAVVMSKEPTTRTRWSCAPRRPAKTYLPTGIALANGKSVTVLPKGQAIPVKQIFIFTTSKDNQRTATVGLLRGTVPIGKVTLEGMIPKLKGEAAIKVTINTNSSGDTTVTMEEIGTDLKVEKDVGSVIDWDEYLNERATEAYETYKKGLAKQTDMILGRDGVIGELPE